VRHSTSVHIIVITRHVLSRAKPLYPFPPPLRWLASKEFPPRRTTGFAPLNYDNIIKVFCILVRTGPAAGPSPVRKCRRASSLNGPRLSAAARGRQACTLGQQQLTCAWTPPPRGSQIVSPTATAASPSASFPLTCRATRTHAERATRARPPYRRRRHYLRTIRPSDRGRSL